MVLEKRLLALFYYRRNDIYSIVVFDQGPDQPLGFKVFRSIRLKEAGKCWLTILLIQLGWLSP